MWGIFKFRDKAEFHNESYPTQDIEEDSIRWRSILYSEFTTQKFQSLKSFLNVNSSNKLQLQLFINWRD